MSSSRVIAPSWKSHPIYRLRKALLIVDGIGLFLALMALPVSSHYDDDPVVSLLFFGASIGFVVWDLVTYLHQQASHLLSLPQHVRRRQRQPLHHDGVEGAPNEQDIQAGGGDEDDGGDDDKTPHWPRLALVVIDAILAVLFLLLYLTALVNMAGPFYMNGVVVLKAYASITILVAAVLHAMSFWKELMARKQQRWVRQQGGSRRPATTCPRCGDHVAVSVPAVLSEEGDEREEGAAAVVRGLNDSVKRRLAQLLRAGKAEAAGSEVLIGPGDVEEGQTEEDSLLPTPDESSTSTQKGYGGIEEGAKAMEAPEERVVKKKGKGRLIDA